MNPKPPLKRKANPDEALIEGLAAPTDPRGLVAWAIGIDLISQLVAEEASLEAVQCEMAQAVSEAMAVKNRPAASFLLCEGGAVPIKTVESALLAMAQVVAPLLLARLNQLKKGREGGLSLSEVVKERSVDATAVRGIDRLIADGLSERKAVDAVGAAIERRGLTHGKGGRGRVERALVRRRKKGKAGECS